MFKNWKTSLAGILGFIVQAGPSLPHIGHFGGSDFTSIATGIATLLLGLFAKDHNVTGGTVQQ